MATKIPAEILIKIINNSVRSSRLTQDLHSLLLVNRFWCKVTIPMLWKLPLSQEYNWWDDKLKRKALCIRTYISCMDTQARTLLIQNGFDLLSSPPQVTFDYPSFTHKFIINNLVYFISIYSQQIISSDNYNKDNNNEISIPKSKILFHEIFKLIINRCTFLDSFKLAKVSENFSPNFRNYSDSIGSILKLPGAPKVFKKLESFTSTILNYESICPLYESLQLICDNILNMDLRLNSYSQIQLLAKLIRVQKRLENLSIISNYLLDCNSILWAIISQKEILKCLRLNFVNFYHFEGKSSPIGQFISLQELYIGSCSGLHKSDSLFLASSFTQLSSFHCFLPKGNPQEFIIKILETGNTNLRNIRLELYHTVPSDIFSAILNYCTRVTQLTLHDLSFEQILAIFNNNFNESRRFLFDCGKKKIDADELLCKMAENVPESLDTIEIRIKMDGFSAGSLRKFFEGWCCKGREGIKMTLVKSTDKPYLSCPYLFDEHFKVIEEYGVEFKFK